jgi:hypothetical protein
MPTGIVSARLFTGTFSGGADQGNMVLNCGVDEINGKWPNLPSGSGGQTSGLQAYIVMQNATKNGNAYTGQGKIILPGLELTGQLTYTTVGNPNPGPHPIPELIESVFGSGFYDTGVFFLTTLNPSMGIPAVQELSGGVWASRIYMGLMLQENP